MAATGAWPVSSPCGAGGGRGGAGGVTGGRAQAVRKAFDLGYTEPDPRDDLGGTDVQRKVNM